MKNFRNIILSFFILIVLVGCLTTTESISYVENGLEQNLDKKKKNFEYTVQVVNQEKTNLGVTESSWLPLQIQDKLNSNIQSYLGMRTIVDSKTEREIKKIQAASEDFGRDIESAIELGKITTAKYAIFTKIRKTDFGYVLGIDFTDLTTGEQLASYLSKEYTRPEYLYGSSGAIDELTLYLAEKLDIQINDLNKNLLTTGSSNFSVDEQLLLAKQNDAQYQKMMAEYDAELKKLSTSNDINAIQNKQRIEAEKALLKEKQNAEKKRQEELNYQKQQSEVDAKLESERSIALKTQRDNLAKEAAKKAKDVRKLKMEKQGVIGQINVIESKKKALVEIRKEVENRCIELYEQLKIDREIAENRIHTKTYSTVELGSDGEPTTVAITRRENQVVNSYNTLTEKFFIDCENVKKSTITQDSNLLTEIRTDFQKLSKTRTVNSLGDELKVSFGQYEGSKNGWNAYLSLYSDGILLYTDSFILKYEALSGKKAPNMETELNDSVIEEYANNVDMYSSLLIRGEPIIYFELDYNVFAENDEKPSQYKFNFNSIRVINTVSGKIIQTCKLGKIKDRTMAPSLNLQEIEGILDKEKKDYRVYKHNAFIIKNLQNRNCPKEIIDIFKGSSIVKFLPTPTQSGSLILNVEMPTFFYKYVMYNEITEDLDSFVNFITLKDAKKFIKKLNLLCGLSDTSNVFRLPKKKEMGLLMTDYQKAEKLYKLGRTQYPYESKIFREYVSITGSYYDKQRWNYKRKPTELNKLDGQSDYIHFTNDNYLEWCYEDYDKYDLNGYDDNDYSIAPFSFRIVYDISNL